MRVWKVLGVAGIAGVAATGVAVARAERRRRQLDPDDVRARLRARHEEALHAEAAAEADRSGADPVAGPPMRRRRLREAFARLRRRR